MDKNRISERTEVCILLGLMFAFTFVISVVFCAQNVSLKDQVKSHKDTAANLQKTLDSCMETIGSKDKEIMDLQEKLNEQNQTLLNLQNALGSSETTQNSQKERIEELEQTNQQLKKERDAIQQLIDEISEIPAEYKEIFFKTSEVMFAATLFNQDIRILKIDTSADKIVDILTDEELKMRGIHNRIEGSYGYEFTMEEFLKKEASIEINGSHYAAIGIPSILETKAFDGKVSLYDICETLTILKAEKAGQFVLDTTY